MKQKLLTDIELDVHELKYLMESFSNEPTSTLSDLLKRSICRMQERLGQLSEEIDAVQIESSEEVEQENEVDENTEDDEIEAEVEAAEEADAAEEAEADAEESAPSVIIESVIEETLVVEEHKPMVLGECIKLSAGLRQSISLNDSFRFARELFAGDTDLMNRVIEQISVMSSYKTAIAFLSSKVDINQESEALNDFLELLKKYFNQSA